MTMEDYFDRLEERFDEEVGIAEEARGMGYDPTEEIEIQFAEDMAERCEELLGIPGLTERIRELEENEVGREEAALQLAEEFASGDLGGFEDREEKADAAVRTAIALLTEGVVAAPIEGIDSVTLNSDGGGGEYLEVHYAGPIRSAGGTGQALSVLVADYVRELMDIDEFDASEEETERTVAGVKMYDSDVGLQYMPSEDDIRTIVSNLSIRLNGDSADTREVSAYRDVVHTNSARGGMCLTIAEGIAQKAAKLQRYTVPLGLENWDWLSDLDLGVDNPGDGDGDEDEEADDEDEDEGEALVDTLGGDEIPGLLQPDLAEKSKKYMKDTIAGRPIIAYPSRPGGYRLRYGRARTAGLAASGVHPASMIILNSFLAPGTQVKTERPGKAQAVTPVDSIEGPTVILESGEVRRIDDEEEARELIGKVDEILDLGEMAVPYGEFLENNAPLVPASYVHEWWEQEAEDAGLTPPDEDRINIAQAFAFAEKYEIPLHPKFTYLWHDLDADEFDILSQIVADGERETTGGSEHLRLDTEAVPYLEALLLPHVQSDDSVRVEDPAATALERCTSVDAAGDNAMEKVNDAAGITVRHRAPTRIGGRMGRPEKSKRREKPKFHGLIPIGKEGGNQRLIDKAARQSLNRNKAIDEEEAEAQKQERRNQNGPHEDDLDAGYILENIAYRENPRTGEPTWRLHDPETGERTIQRRWCSNCQMDAGDDEKCPSCGNETTRHSKRPFDIHNAYQDALDNLDERESNIGKVKGVKGLESESKIVEPFEKALLRAKYDILSFSDGTARYDLTDLPLTSFRPDEVGTDVETLRELGYETALDGSDLTEDDQLVELKVQDIVIHEDAGDYMLRTANYVDDLLEKHYGLEPYYDADTKEDLVGSLMLGLAPHTSAGVLCRLVGFTEASAGYAHPFFHAAKRRNCFEKNTDIEVAVCDGEWRADAESIKELFDESLESALDGKTGDVDGVRVLDDESVVVELEEVDVDTWFTDDGGSAYTRVGNPIWSSVGEEAYTEWQKVTAFSRHPAPDHMIEFRTADGQTLTVTPDHSMVRVGTENHPFEDVDASELNAGDLVYSRDNPDDPGGGRFTPTRITSKRHVENEDEHVYCLTVKDQHQTVANNILTGQCDGDEDSIMLLLDGLINYSEEYLDHGRTGWSMDKPIVATTVLDPTEIDDEAHNVDVVGQYPRKLYEASMHQLGPKEIDIDVAENYIRGDFTDFKHTVETSSIHAGPNQSSYVTSGDMDEKLDSQFDLAKRTRAVDEKNLAEKVIDKHFLPDIRGNLRSFAQQDVRCHRCGITYRRIPLDGVCRKCNKSLLLTIYEGSVDKYVGKSLRMAEEYDIDPYLQQSIEILDDEIQSLFNDDTAHQTGLGDFM